MKTKLTFSEAAILGLQIDGAVPKRSKGSRMSAGMSAADFTVFGVQKVRAGGIGQRKAIAILKAAGIPAFSDAKAKDSRGRLLYDPKICTVTPIAVANRFARRAARILFAQTVQGGK